MNWLMKMLKVLFRRAGELSPNCREATRMQSEGLDRHLGLAQQIGLRIHLILCKWCRRYGKQIGFLRSAARRHEEHEQGLPPQSLPPEARERIKRRLREAEK
jgi:hypothetical protein